MNIRMPLAAIALCLASTMAFAADQTSAPATTPAASSSAAKPAAKPVKKHHAAKCKADQTLVNGKCEEKKAG